MELHVSHKRPFAETTVEGLQLAAETVAGVEFPPIEVPFFEVAPPDLEARTAATDCLPTAAASGAGVDRRAGHSEGHGATRSDRCPMWDTCQWWHRLPRASRSTKATQ